MYNSRKDALYYWAGHQNFGDELSLYLVEKMTGRAYRQADKYADGKLVAIGSLLTWDVMHTDCRVWGTGTLTGHALIPTQKRWFPINRKLRSLAISLKGKRARIFAVRGPLTRELILQSGMECPEVYGDPAILMPDYFSPTSTKTHRAGLILHHSQSALGNVEALSEAGIKLISIQREGNSQIEAFINDVHSCEKIFSTSLHGLIIAQCYDVPAQWVVIDGAAIHDDVQHKFMDYFIGAGQQSQIPEVIAPELNSDHVISMADRLTMPTIQLFTGRQRLHDVFPD